MPNEESLKLRNVLKDIRGEEVCLEDVIMAFAGCSAKFSALEYKNTKHSFKEARKAFNEAKKIMQDFEVRFKGPIREDIILALSKIDKRVDIKRSKETGLFLSDEEED